MKAGRIFILGLSWVMMWGATGVAQPPDTMWTRTYGGTGDEWARDIIQTTDGGYVIAGFTNSLGSGGEDAYVLKIDSAGDVVWSTTIGGAAEDRVYALDETNDGGFIAAGRTHSFGLDSADFYLVKLNGIGDTLWTRTYGGTGMERAYAVQQTRDEGYIIAGYTTSFGAGLEDFYLVKTDSNGDTLWTRTYGGVGTDWAYSACQTDDGGYILAGYTTPSEYGDASVYLVKTDQAGDTLWTRAIRRNPTFYFDMAYYIQQTTDGGYIFAGQTPDGGTISTADILIGKTDSQGNVEWIRNFGGNDDEDQAFQIKQTPDGCYIFVGYTYCWGAGSMDVYLVKLDSSGTMLWSRTCGGISNDNGYAVRWTTDGGYVIAGYTYSFGAGNSDMWVIKTCPDAHPEIEVSTTLLNFEDVIIGEHRDLPLIIRNLGNATLDIYTIVTTDTVFTTNFDPVDSLIEAGDSLEVTVTFTPRDCFVWYIDTLRIFNNDELKEVILLGVGRTGPGVDPSLSKKFPKVFALSSFYPNPFNSETTISYDIPIQGRVSVNIYNILGQEVATVADGVVNPGTYSVVWDAKDLPSGIYFVQMEAGGFQKTQKVVLLK
jgi:hypothetical protein